jgi:hypothetical protein
MDSGFVAGYYPYKEFGSWLFTQLNQFQMNLFSLCECQTAHAVPTQYYKP